MLVRTHRAVALTAAAVVAAGSVALSAAPASAAPADPDLTGTVVNAAGAPLAGIAVTAFTTPADGSVPQEVDFAVTNASGVYTFTGLDPASLVASNPTDAAINTETDFKLFFQWSPTNAELHSTGYLDRGLGGTKTVRAASSVIVPANAAATAPTQALPNASGVALTVTNPAGTPVNSYAYGALYAAGAYDPIDSFVTSGRDSDDDDFYLPNPAPEDGQVWIGGLEPGDYLVNASGSDFNTTTNVGTDYVSRFFGGDGSYADAKTVEAKAGVFTPVTVQLSATLEAIQKPQIIGNSSIGSKLKADPGTWLRQQGTEFTYQWLRNKDVVATGDTYKVTKKDTKKKLQLVVTAYNGSYVGTATSDKTSKVGQKSKVTVKKAGVGTYAVSVKVQKKALAKKIKVSGKVALVTEDGSLASKQVKLKGGSATLKLKAKYAGEKVYVKYFGNNRLGSDTATIGGKKKK